MEIVLENYQLHTHERLLIQLVTGIDMESIDIVFNARYFGSYRPATVYEPPEYPELEITDEIISEYQYDEEYRCSVCSDLSKLIVSLLDWEYLEEIAVYYLSE